MPRRKRRKSAPREKKRWRRIIVFTVFSLFFLCAALFLSLMDKRLLPTVIQMEEYKITARMNEAINSAVGVINDSRSGGLSSEDFYVATRDESGKVTSLTANTVLINEVCAAISQYIDSLLTTHKNDYVSVPVGALLGIEWLANAGPSYKISVLPVGVSRVDYETSFTSVGINQINLQVWLTVSSKMQIVNPLQTRELEIERTVPLVNTVFAGEIPGVYVSPGQ